MKSDSSPIKFDFSSFMDNIGPRTVFLSQTKMIDKSKMEETINQSIIVIIFCQNGAKCVEADDEAL